MTWSREKKLELVSDLIHLKEYQIRKFEEMMAKENPSFLDSWTHSMKEHKAKLEEYREMRNELKTKK